MYRKRRFSAVLCGVLFAGMALPGAAAAQDTRSDLARCIDPAAFTRALRSFEDTQQLQLTCTRVISRSAQIASTELAETLKVRGRLLVELARYTASGLPDVKLTRQALADFNLVLAIDPLSVESYNARGEIRGSLLDFKGALEDETTAINMRPTLYAAYFARAEVALKLNRANISSEVAEAAIADYRAALQSDDIRARRGAYIEQTISGLLQYVTKPQTQ